MLQRLYVHNFRCLENFELVLAEHHSCLLIGRNGVGKSTIVNILHTLQKIGYGINHVGDLVTDKDFSQGHTQVPIQFEIKVLIEQCLYEYKLVLELSAGFKVARVAEEKLTVAGEIIYTRELAQVVLRPATDKETQFSVDWHAIALSVIYTQSTTETDPIATLKNWLANLMLLAPIPALMSGETNGKPQKSDMHCQQFANWLSQLLSNYPAAYVEMINYLKVVMPDIEDFVSKKTGTESSQFSVRFKTQNIPLEINFDELSDGEKCFFLCGLVLAANKVQGSLFCFWDEPDNYLSLQEVNHFITLLRNRFQGNGQILMTSHHPGTIEQFSKENTFFLDRQNHLSPTRVKLLTELEPEQLQPSLVNQLTLGDIEL